MSGGLGSDNSQNAGVRETIPKMIYAELCLQNIIQDTKCSKQKVLLTFCRLVHMAKKVLLQFIHIDPEPQQHSYKNLGPQELTMVPWNKRTSTDENLWVIQKENLLDSIYMYSLFLVLILKRHKSSYEFFYNI